MRQQKLPCRDAQLRIAAGPLMDVVHCDCTQRGCVLGGEPSSRRPNRLVAGRQQERLDGTAVSALESLWLVLASVRLGSDTSA